MILKSHQKYLAVIGGGALVSIAGLMLVVRKLDPCSAPGEYLVCADTSAMAMILFFISLFFVFATTCTLLGYFLRLWFNRYEIFVNNINLALRQGVLLAFVAVGCAGMLALHVLRWWSGLLLIAIALLLELYFTRSE